MKGKNQLKKDSLEEILIEQDVKLSLELCWTTSTTRLRFTGGMGGGESTSE